MSTLYVNTLTPNTGDTVSISGSLFVSGNINLGDANTDGISFNADVDSHIIPNSTQTFNLGSTSFKWNNVYARNFIGTASIAKELSGSAVGNTGNFVTLFGTLGTSAQTNITSVGTLSALTVAGNIGANGNIVGDNSTQITNIDSISLNGVVSRVNAATKISLGNTGIDVLVNDIDVFDVSTTKFTFGTNLSSVNIQSPLTASSNISASGTIVGSNIATTNASQLTALTASVVLQGSQIAASTGSGTLVVATINPTTISASANISGKTGSFIGGLNLGTATYGGSGADNIQLYAPNTDITAKTVSASGTIVGSNIATTNASQLTALTASIVTLLSKEVAATASIVLQGSQIAASTGSGNLVVTTVSPTTVSASGTINALTGSFKYLKTDGQISSSGNLTAHTGSFLGGLNLGTHVSDDIQLFAPNTDITAKTVSASGTIVGSNIATTNASQLTALTASVVLQGSQIAASTGSGNLIVTIVSPTTVSASGVVSGLTVHGRASASSATNASAVGITMTEAVYPGGSVFGLDMDSSTNDIAYTLPALTAGLRYTWIVNTTAGSGVTLTISAPSAVLNGLAICDDANEDIVGTNFIIAATKAIKGTRIEAVSDGVIWHLTAICLCDVADVSTS